MKKLFKEAWKSFASSKGIIIGLIILIFLTSGIITLIFDVVNFYQNQYSSYKQKSVLHDATMNASLNLYGDKYKYPYVPLDFDEYNNDSKNKPGNDYSPENQWSHIETNDFIDNINVNKKSEYIKINEISNKKLPNTLGDLYIKTKDLSYLINATNSISPITMNDSSATTSITFDSKGNNKITIFKKDGDNYTPINDGLINQIDGIYDTYSNGKWTASNDVKKLYSSSKFKQLVVNNLTKQVFIKSVLTSSNSSEKKLYNSNPELFTTISADEVASMLGFVQKGLLKIWTIDATKSWILDGDINQYDGKKASDFFGANNLPKIKNPAPLLSPIENVNKLDLSSITINNTWFVYSKYEYIYTKHEKRLAGIKNNVVDNSLWTGYYYDYLNNLSKTNPNEFNNLSKISYWTKEVKITKVDKQGNEVELEDSKEKIISTFPVEIILDDLDQNPKLTNLKDPTKTTSLRDLTNTTNVNQNALSQITINKEAININSIDLESKSYQYNCFLKEASEYIDKMGLRETLTVNSNNDNKTNVYQFINLGNSENEINWNGINVKQNVGKLIETDLNNPIFSLESNINPKSESVPQNEVAPIVRLLLNGLSLNRTYLNPMISFNAFPYYEVGSNINEANNKKMHSGDKIIWLTKNGADDKKNLYGIAPREVREKIIIDPTTGEYKEEKYDLYYLLKCDYSGDNKLIWENIDGYQQGVKDFTEVEKFINENQLNFAPFDYFKNPIKIVGENGWLRQDSEYIDKYSVPFQYLLPSSEIINQYNEAQKDLTDDKHGMEIFRDNLIYSLTLSIKPLISSKIWEVLCEGVNTAFSYYGFGAGLTPPAKLTTASMMKVAIGILRDSIVAYNQNFTSILFSNLFDGIKRKLNPDGNATLEQQQENLAIQLEGIFNILRATDLPFLNIDPTSIANLVKPAEFLDALKELLNTINLDNAVLEIWNNLYVDNGGIPVDQPLGTGNLVPYIYKNIYSTDLFKSALIKLIKSINIQNIPANLIGMISMKSPQEGYQYLLSKIEKGYNNQDTISLQNILNLFSVPIMGMGALGDWLVEKAHVQLPSTEIVYNPNSFIYLELDMDLLWYLDNFVFIDKNSNSRSSETKPLKLFGVDLSYFLNSATSAFTEIKDDYNQITFNDNAGKIAIVNQAFLDKNHKKVYSSKTLSSDLDDLSKISDQYKINVSGVEYVIVGKDFSVDYMYPVINSENMTVNTGTQALVYVNQFGFDRARRSNEGSSLDKYFLIKNKLNQSLKTMQTKLNQLVYYYSTGQQIDDSNANSADFNNYKSVYLSDETSLLNPERAMRITVVDGLIDTLKNVQFIIGIFLCVLTAIVIIFVVRRYVVSRSKVLGILKAQGYSSMQIAISSCLLTLFVTVIGSIVGYIAGFLAQLGIYQLLSIFWTLPITGFVFNWLTFTLALVIPVVCTCALTIIAILLFLRKNKPLSMINGSMEVVENAVATQIHKRIKNTSIKNKYSISLALGSISKLIALFISSLFTAGVILFFITSNKTFENSVYKTYKNRNYTYLMTYNTPTIEAGNIQTFVISPNDPNETYNFINNSLYVPVGDSLEGSTYLSNYFKPGYNSFINKNLVVDGISVPANGNVSVDDTTTPHILTKASIDLTVNAGGLSINVWNNLYNAIPESQRYSIINASIKAGKWMKWTQEGKELSSGYVTRFHNFNQEDEFLGIWDINSNDWVRDNKNQIYKLPHFDYFENKNNLEKSTFKYNEAKSNLDDKQNEENASILLITGEPYDNKIRYNYRNFLTKAYQLMFNYSKDSNNGNLLDKKLQSEQPEYALDYFITPDVTLLGTNQNDNSIDETFTYINAKNDSNINPTIYGYDPNSKYIKIVDSSNKNLLEKTQQFNETNVYPLIINHVVFKKYNLKINDTIKFNIENKYKRYQNKIKEQLNVPVENNEVTFKIIGISETYVNEEWLTSKSVANKILGLDQKGFNGIISNCEAPVTLSNSLPLYSYSNYWGGDSKIFNPSEIENLSNAEKENIVNIYKQIYYNISPSTGQNISLIAQSLRMIFPDLDNDRINDKIKEFLETSDDISNLTSTNNDDVAKANRWNKKFIDIYSNDMAATFFKNAISNGVEKEYIEQASSTVNEGMTIIIAVSLIISLTILVMITSMIIVENERNIAIFGILGYSTREKLRMFFFIYIPVVLIAVALSILVVWAMIPAFVSTILSTTSIALSINLSFWHILAAFGIISFIFAITCLIVWFAQGRVKPVMLLKGM